MKNCEGKDEIQWCPFGKPKYLGDFEFADHVAFTTISRNQMQRRTEMIAETVWLHTAKLKEHFSLKVLTLFSWRCCFNTKL